MRCPGRVGEVGGGGALLALLTGVRCPGRRGEVGGRALLTPNYCSWGSAENKSMRESMGCGRGII